MLFSWDGADRGRLDGGDGRQVIRGRRSWLRASTMLARASVALLGVLIAASSSAQALTAWTGSASTDWFTPGNWSDGVPAHVEGSFAVIDTVAPNPTVINGGVASTTWLYVGHSGIGQLTIQNGGALWSGISRLGFNAGAQGTVTVTGPGSSWTPFSELVVGGAGIGQLTIANGGAVSNTEGYIGQDAGSQGVVSVTGPGSSWTNSGTLTVGVSGNGQLTIADGGGVVSNLYAYIGQQAGSQGVVSVAGPGSSWTNSGSLTVGESGTGQLTIENGGAMSSASATIGVNAGAQGIVTVTGAGSSWTNSGTLAVGNFGTGQLTIANGGVVSNGAGYLGVNAGSQATVTVTGAGAEWTNSSDLIVGISGNGQLTIADGGAVSNTAGHLGFNAGSQGTVTVTGAGSRWTNGSLLVVGYSGIGQLTIANGGAVTSLGGTIGNSAVSQGTVTVTGAGASWITHLNLSVGGLGTGRLIIAAGGMVSNTFSHLGAGAGSQGTVMVTGAGSTWTNTFDIWVGSVATATGQLTIADGGQVNARSVRLADFASSTGVLAIGAPAGQAAVAPGILNAPSVRFGNGAGRLTFNHTGTAYEFAAAISGNGTVEVLSGTTILTGVSPFTGPTTVAAGKLAVNGAIANSSVTVLSGAVLAGAGTVGATTIQSGATVAPGNSIGTLTVNGNLALAPGSTYAVEIAGNGASDRIAASGMATVTGSQVTLTALDPQTSYISGQRYTIITAAGGVSGAVAGAVSQSAFLELAVDHQPNQVDLVIAVKTSGPGTPPGPGTAPSLPPGGAPGPGPIPPPSVFETVAWTRNQFATAVGLDTLPQAGGTLALYNRLLMLGAGSARAAFDALSGEVHASAKGALVDESWLLRAAVNDRLRSAFGAVGAQPMATVNYGFGADPAARGGPMLRNDRFAVWGQGYGAWGRTDSDRNAAKLTRSTGGFLFGADAAVLDTLRLGVIAGYSRTKFDVNGRLSSGESDNYHLGLYGGGQWGALDLRTGASYTWHDIQSHRSVAFAGFGDTLQAGYKAGTAQVFGELGYRVGLGHAALEPFAGLAYVNLHSDGFSERGGAAALSGRGDDTSLGYATLGLRASTALALQGMDLTLRGGLAWRHAFGDVSPQATLTFAGASSFTVAGLPIAKNAALVEAGLDLAIGPGATLGLAYTGQLAESTQDHAFKGMLAVRF